MIARTKGLLKLILIGLLTITFISCYRQPWGPGGGYGGHMMGYGFGGGFGGFMWIIWILIIGLVIYFVVAAQRRGNTLSGFGADNRERPIDILKKRYARGEISKEDYERLKRDIES